MTTGVPPTVGPLAGLIEFNVGAAVAVGYSGTGSEPPPLNVAAPTATPAATTPPMMAAGKGVTYV